MKAWSRRIKGPYRGRSPLFPQWIAKNVTFLCSRQSFWTVNWMVHAYIFLFTGPQMTCCSDGHSTQRVTNKRIILTGFNRGNACRMGPHSSREARLVWKRPKAEQNKWREDCLMRSHRIRLADASHLHREGLEQTEKSRKSLRHENVCRSNRKR